jgi:hypothetical protein
MEILALPFFGFLLYLWVPGIHTARRVFQASDEKARFVGIFALLLVIEFLAGFCAPFALSRGSRSTCGP